VKHTNLDSAFDAFTQGATATEPLTVYEDWMEWTATGAYPSLDLPTALEHRWGACIAEGYVMEATVKGTNYTGVYECRALVNWGWKVER